MSSTAGGRSESGTRANVALNAALRLLVLVGLAVLWLVETPDPTPPGLATGTAVGLAAGLGNLALGRSERFMRVWRRRTPLRVVVGGSVAGCFIYFVDRAFVPTVIALALAGGLSFCAHAFLFVRSDEDF